MKLECKTIGEWVYVSDVESGTTLARFEQLSEASAAIHLVKYILSNCFEDILQSILDCPYTLDQATIPKAGIDVAPEQVVANLSISYIKIKKLEHLLELIRS